MGVDNLSLVSALKTKMQWHQARQQLLAQNVANADTPGYRVQDLQKPDFSRMAMTTANRSNDLGMRVKTTNVLHISASMPSASSEFDPSGARHFEITPEGNEVVLEEEMLKVTSNQLDYQAATSLYSKTLGLFRIAIGR